MHACICLRVLPVGAAGLEALAVKGDWGLVEVAKAAWARVEGAKEA